MDDLALQLRDVVVSYGGLNAVDGVSMTVHRSQPWAVIGPNGAGKTTLFKTISGEVKVASGAVCFRGRDITSLPPYRRARMGIGRTYQITNLFPDLTVAETVALAVLRRGQGKWRAWWPLRMRGELAERVDEALNQVRLADRRTTRADELSHGEQRQLELALAVATAPDLLVLDEPAAGLTASERTLLTDLISGLPRDITLLMIEHDIEMAFGLADRVLCMDNGVAIAEGTPNEIRANEDVQAVYLRAD